MNDPKWLNHLLLHHFFKEILGEIVDNGCKPPKRLCYFILIECFSYLTKFNSISTFTSLIALSLTHGVGNCTAQCVSDSIKACRIKEDNGIRKKSRSAGPLVIELLSQ